MVVYRVIRLWILRGDSAASVIPSELSRDAGNPSYMTRDDETFEPDPERVALLREVADDVRGDSLASRMVAATLYRVSDCYDPDEETTVRDVYVNMREIIRTTEDGQMDRR